MRTAERGRKVRPPGRTLHAFPRDGHECARKIRSIVILSRKQRMTMQFYLQGRSYSSGPWLARSSSATSFCFFRRAKAM